MSRLFPNPFDQGVESELRGAQPLANRALDLARHWVGKRGSAPGAEQRVLQKEVFLSVLRK